MTLTTQQESTYRLARCSQCGRETYSHPHLNLWCAMPFEPRDRYYCGCYLYD